MYLPPLFVLTNKGMSLVAIVKEEFPHIQKKSKNVNPKQFLFELQADFALIMESD